MESFDFLNSPDTNLFSRPDAGDESLFVVFYKGVVQNQGRTIEEGRPIYDDVECVRIIIPGDKNSVIDRPAERNDKRRFPKQYAAFLDGAKEEDQVSGTRLSDWPFLSRAQIAEFKHLGLVTVEHIAECRDDVVSRVPGLQQLKRNAQLWLGKAKGAAEAAKQAKVMDDQAAQIAALQDAVRDLSARNERLETERMKSAA